MGLSSRRLGGSSSPLAFPSSSPAKNKTPRAGMSANRVKFGTAPDSEPLAFPTSPMTAPKNRRGDIHSSITATPSKPRSRRVVGDITPGFNSDGPPSSAAAALSAPDPSDEPDEIRAIWGTTVNLATTMALFRDFLRGFKPKYRTTYDRALGLRTKAFTSPDQGEITLYEGYLRRMRITGETNLNLDINNMLAYPPSKKLYNQLQKYPQEVIPAMDQVLKDLMLEIADADQHAGMEGMIEARAEGTR